MTNEQKKKIAECLNSIDIRFVRMVEKEVSPQYFEDCFYRQYGPDGYVNYIKFLKRQWAAMQGKLNYEVDLK